MRARNAAGSTGAKETAQISEGAANSRRYGIRLVENPKRDWRSELELRLYRARTVALLRKYFRMSVELGHLPSLLGREFFRTHVTSYTTHTFEDAVIFVHDVERCLELIGERDRQVIGKIYFQQYTNEETAQQLGCAFSTIERWKTEAMNALTRVLLERKLLEKMPQVALDIEEADDIEPRQDDPGISKKGPRSVKGIFAVAVVG